MKSLCFHNIIFKIIWVCFFVITKINAQTNYKITYRVIEPKIHGSLDNLDEKGKRLSEQIFSRAKNLNYILIANNNESYFELEKTLTKGEESPMEQILLNMAKLHASFNEKTFSNFRNDSIIFVKKLLEKDFLIKSKQIDFNWIIQNETKNISGFDAIKAEGTYYDYIKRKDLKVVAWFIPSIPIQSGPDIFMGLPGLVAEVDLKGARVAATKIELNKKNSVTKIDNSKAMTLEEYEILIRDLTKKYIDN